MRRNRGVRTSVTIGRIEPTTTRTTLRPSAETKTGAVSAADAADGDADREQHPEDPAEASVRSEPLDEREARDVEKRVPDSDREQGDDHDRGCRMHADEDDRQAPEAERQGERASEAAPPREHNGTEPADDATDAEHRGQPPDSAAPETEKVEGDRDQQHHEEPANEELHDADSPRRSRGRSSSAAR